MNVLHGIRVIDLGNFITGPYAAMLLAEYGADVVKIERPGLGGDCSQVCVRDVQQAPFGARVQVRRDRFDGCVPRVDRRRGQAVGDL